MRLGVAVAAAALAGLALAGTPAEAEPIFLAKQYARCATCHFSATGGTLLTPYGRSLSRQEISTWGRTREGSDPGTGGGVQEEQFLFGLFGDSLGPVSLGLALRPSHLEFDFEGFESERDLWMRADAQAAVRVGSFTAYGELGRYPTKGDDLDVVTREHWVAWETEGGVGIRAGRFMTPYGLRIADHESLTRTALGLGEDDQIYGVELFDASERRLVQLTLGPGRAESLVEDDGGDAWVVAGRLQFDFESRQSLVFSGMYRGSSDFADEQWLGGIAHGWAPSERLVFWSELDTLATEGWDGTPQYTLWHQASFEVLRGLWLSFNPQLQTEVGNVSGGRWRLGGGLQFFPRSHWNVNVHYYREHERTSDFDADVLVLQLHVYL